MPAMEEDERPKKKITHEIGQDLALLSVSELQERIALMNEEISRLEDSHRWQAGLAQRGRPVFQKMTSADRSPQPAKNRKFSIILNPC